jgi:hypothetical protein
MTRALPRFVSNTAFASCGRRIATSADSRTFASATLSAEKPLDIDVRRFDSR